MGMASMWRNGPPAWDLERIDLGLKEYSPKELEDIIDLWLERYRLVIGLQNQFSKSPKTRILVY